MKIVLFTLFGIALTCRTACSASKNLDGRCYYICHDACSETASKHQQDFFNDLLRHSHACKIEDGSLSCEKTNAFPSCYDHAWNCGKDC